MKRPAGAVHETRDAVLGRLGLSLTPEDGHPSGGRRGPVEVEPLGVQNFAEVDPAVQGRHNFRRRVQVPQDSEQVVESLAEEGYRRVATSFDMRDTVAELCDLFRSATADQASAL